VLCNLSVNMTHTKCATMKGNTSCGQCPGAGTELITFDEPTYEALRELAEFEGVSVKVALERWVTELATDLRRREERRVENV
jgi:hypothetical protein